MSPRFALRWTLVGLVCALVIVLLGALLFRLSPPPPTPPQVSIDDLMAAALMPLDERGMGTQVISGTTLSFKLSPYPARATITSTVTLVAIASHGQTPALVTPTLYVAQASQPSTREFPMLLQDDGSYVAAGVLFPQPGPWRVRVDVYVGDATPANMLIAVEAR
jgi:hypothetical protein